MLTRARCRRDSTMQSAMNTSGPISSFNNSGPIGLGLEGQSFRELKSRPGTTALVSAIAETPPLRGDLPPGALPPSPEKAPTPAAQATPSMTKGSKGGKKPAKPKLTKKEKAQEKRLKLVGRNHRFYQIVERPATAGGSKFGVDLRVVVERDGHRRTDTAEVDSSLATSLVFSTETDEVRPARTPRGMPRARVLCVCVSGAGQVVYMCARECVCVG